MRIDKLTQRATPTAFQRPPKIVMNVITRCELCPQVGFGQKKRATLSDHPIAIARSCDTYRLFSDGIQALS